MVIMGQYKEIEIVKQKNERLEESKNKFYDELQHDIDFKKSLLDMKTKGEQVLKEMEINLAKVTKDLEAKKSETDACQNEMVKTFYWMYFFLVYLH